MQDKRQSYKRWKKMEEHLEEFETFFNQRIRSFKTMIKAQIEHEKENRREGDVRV